MPHLPPSRRKTIHEEVELGFTAGSGGPGGPALPPLRPRNRGRQKSHRTGNMIELILERPAGQGGRGLDGPGDGQVLRPRDPDPLLQRRPERLRGVPALPRRDRRGAADQARFLLHLSGRRGAHRPDRYQEGHRRPPDDDRAHALDRSLLQADPGPGLAVRGQAAAVRAPQRGVRPLRPVRPDVQRADGRQSHRLPEARLQAEDLDAL